MGADALLQAARLVIALHETPDGNEVPGFRVRLDPMAERQIRDAIAAAEGAEAARVAAERVRAAAPALLAACLALLDVQSARRHPLGAPDEGIATAAVEAASLARRAIAAAEGRSGD